MQEPLFFFFKFSGAGFPWVLLISSWEWLLRVLAQPWANPLLLCCIFHLSFVQKREVSKRQCPVSDVEMCTGASLEGNILVMHHRWLVLFSFPVLFLWFWGLGCSAGKRHDNEPIRYVKFLQHCFFCVVGEAMNQYRFCGSFGWFGFQRLLTTTYAKNIWQGGVCN